MKELKTTYGWVVVLLTATIGLSGCAPSVSGNVYDRYYALQTQQVQLGTVDHVRLVEIGGTQSGLGPAAGGVAGGIAGSYIGSGRGSALGALGGALLGGLAGGAIEEEATRRAGLEVTVRLDSGRMVAIVQQANETFVPGERVRVLTAYDGTARVTH